ncbi:ABC transporter permease [Ovoidimarina sediminis]|uniref:ABC transporter permease n=1 Tax=Ovoidimarina sediminis TaxID=3079856 RepID=UPI0029062BC9|nr:ABC transporter permease [Rhodophyticola sp. MJ-SS7]MDU8945221.1 ABC transporter permease [Rhodophyticola sp. MJ-SS7]
MSYSITLGALLSHWRVRPFQALTLVLGLALATALWSGVQALNAEARASYAQATSVVTGTRPVLVREGGVIDEREYVSLRRAGWQVSPVVEGWIGSGRSRVKLFGIDALTAPRDTQAATFAFSDGMAGTMLSPGRLFASPVTAARLAGEELPPVHASDALAPGIAIADIGIAQRLLGMEGQLSHLVILETQPMVRPPLADLAPGLTQRKIDGAEDLARLTDSFHLNLTAFGFLSFAVGLFIVNGAIGLAFEQRRPLFRTLRALGVPGRTLTIALASELLAFALLAGCLGIVLGYLIAAALLPDVAATLRGLYGVPVEGTLTIRPAWWAAGLLIAMLGTALAGAAALWKTARLPVLAPARPRAWAMAGHTAERAQAIAALGLAALAGALVLLGSGLVAAFAMLGALLIAAALALPPLLSRALQLFARGAKTAESEWFWADTRQQLPGLSLALMALLLALAANIGVGTMVSSFRLTFAGWLDQRLASELYISTRTDAEGAALTAWLEARGLTVLPIWNVDASIDGAPGTIYGVADHATYRDNWPLIDASPDVWDKVAAGEAALINEQYARRGALRPGSTVTLPVGDPLEVAGIYSDYGNPEAQILVSVATLTERFPGVERQRFGVRVAQEDANALAKEITDAFGIPPENMTDQASLKRFSIEVFERTFTVTGALNILTLGVAGIAILTSLLTLATMRLPQLAPVWAVGLTRARLARLELLRALVLAAFTAIAALPVGLTLAWILLAVINVEAFGWRLPMHLFPGDWIKLGLLAILAAGLAGLWPAIKLARLAPADLVRVFSNER